MVLDKARFNYGDIKDIDLDSHKGRYKIKLLSVTTSKGPVPINGEPYNTKIFDEYLKMFQKEMRTIPNFEDKWKEQIHKAWPTRKENWDEDLSFHDKGSNYQKARKPYEILPGKVIYIWGTNNVILVFMIAIMNIVGKPGDYIEVQYEKFDDQTNYQPSKNLNDEVMCVECNMLIHKNQIAKETDEGVVCIDCQ